jgi:hypothetical protein
MKLMKLSPHLTGRYPAIRVATALTVVCFVALLAAPALAQDGVGGAIDTVVTNITGLIKSISVGIGILGLSLWGLGKVARPVFPEMASLTQQYIQSLIIGLVVIFMAAQIAEMIVGAIGGGG